jgi:hypothetical protein
LPLKQIVARRRRWNRVNDTVSCFETPLEIQPLSEGRGLSQKGAFPNAEELSAQPVHAR